MDETPPTHPAEPYFRSHCMWPGEEIRWVGEPGRLNCMKFNWWFSVVGCFMCLFLFMLWFNSSGISDVRLPEFLVVLFSVWLAVTPLRYLWKASRTAYFVTNMRAVILQKGLRVRETFYNPAEITDYKLVRGRGDRGDIRLRISRNRLKTAYDEDREKWAPPPGAGFGFGTNSSPFVAFTDGFWGANHISKADAALKDLLLGEERKWQKT